MAEPAMALLQLAQFSPLLGTQFQLQAEGAPAQPATLVEAAPTGTPAFQGREAFSLLFECPGSAVLPQGLHAVSHPALGALDLFLVPVGRSPAGVRYEAVFN